MIMLSDAWRTALGRLTDERARRVMVIGGVDVGKSSFVTALLRQWEGAGERPMLLDADPGQKMVGPPGTVTLGVFDNGSPRLAALRFVGTTSAGTIGALADAAGKLTGLAGDRPLTVNSSGFVRGPGAALKLAKIRAVRPDVVVAIGPPADLRPILARAGVPSLSIEASPLARRKTASARAAARRAAFAAHLASAVPISVPDALRLDASIAVCLADRSARPVCAVVDAAGDHRSLGVIDLAADGTPLLVASPGSQPVAGVQLGAMWARRAPEGWRLLDTLLPASAG